MATPTVALSETSPAGTAYVRDGNDRIMEYKIQNREILAVDHYYPSSGQNDACGRHKQVTLIEAADIGAGATGIPILGAQTVVDRPELTFTNENNVDITITKGIYINAAALDPTLSAWAAIIALIYPVGSVYINASVATNPGTLLGFGTWTAFGAGKVMVGINAADTDFDVAEETGGEKTHTLTTAEMPAHTHTHEMGGASGGSTMPYSGNTAQGPTPATSSTGGGGAHNNLQPYIVVYMWKRTA